MKKTLLLIPLAFALVVTGCLNHSDQVTLDQTYSDLMGLSRDEVIRRFGSPKRIDSLTGGGEEIIYGSQRGNFTFVLSLRDGKVGRVVYAGNPGETVPAEIDRILNAYSGRKNWEREMIDVYQSQNLAWVRSDQRRTVAIQESTLYVWGDDRSI